jgi:hypothetical protein
MFSYTWWCSGIYHFTICHEKKLNRKKGNIFPCGSIFLDPTHMNKYTVFSWTFSLCNNYILSWLSGTPHLDCSHIVGPVPVPFFLKKRRYSAVVLYLCVSLITDVLFTKLLMLSNNSWQCQRVCQCKDRSNDTSVWILNLILSCQQNHALMLLISVFLYADSATCRSKRKHGSCSFSRWIR